MSVKTKSVEQLERDVVRLTAKLEKQRGEVQVTSEFLRTAKAQLKEAKAAKKARRSAASSDCEE